jgi:hypothetical protein
MLRRTWRRHGRLGRSAATTRQRWQFRRGFVEGITLSADGFIDNVMELFRLAPDPMSVYCVPPG